MGVATIGVEVATAEVGVTTAGVGVANTGPTVVENGKMLNSVSEGRNSTLPDDTSAST